MAAAAVTGYQVLKFSLDDPKLDLVGNSYNSIPVIRYAEVLLNYAEEKGELGGRASLMWTCRPHLTCICKIIYSDVPSISLMEIRRERDIELTMEGFRYTDLKRWKLGKLLEKEKDGIYVPQEGQLLDLNSEGKPDVAFVTNPATPVAGVYYFKINNGIAKLSECTKGRLLYQLNLKPDFPDYKYYATLPYTELILNKNLVQSPGCDHS